MQVRVPAAALPVQVPGKVVESDPSAWGRLDGVRGSWPLALTWSNLGYCVPLENELVDGQFVLCLS